MALKKQKDASREQAEELAIGALSFLADRPEALARFLRLTGLHPASLRSAASQPGFLAGLLDYYLANDGLLVDYAHEAGIAPQDFVRVRQALD